MRKLKLSSLDAFLKSVDSMLSVGSHGFERENADFDYIVRWSRPTSWSDDFYETIALYSCVHDKDQISVNAHLTIESSLLSSLEVDAGLNRCSQIGPYTSTFPQASRLSLFLVALNWLVVNAAGKKTDWVAATAKGDHESDEFVYAIEHYGLPLFQSVSTLDDITSLMSDFGSYRRHAKFDGFKSMDPATYLAAAYFYSGNCDKGRHLIDSWLAGNWPLHVQARIRKDGTYEEYQTCRLLLVKGFFTTDSS